MKNATHILPRNTQATAPIMKKGGAFLSTSKRATTKKMRQLGKKQITADF